MLKDVFQEMQKYGIHRDDPRLKETIVALKDLCPNPTFDDFKLDCVTFRNILADNYVFINKVFKNRMVVPDFDAFRNNITK